MSYEAVEYPAHPLIDAAREWVNTHPIMKPGYADNAEPIQIWECLEDWYPGGVSQFAADWAAPEEEQIEGFYREPKVNT